MNFYAIRLEVLNIYMMLLCAGTETNSNYRTAGRRLGRNLIWVGQRQRKSGEVDSEHVVSKQKYLIMYVKGA